MNRGLQYVTFLDSVRSNLSPRFFFFWNLRQLCEKFSFSILPHYNFFYRSSSISEILNFFTTAVFWKFPSLLRNRQNKIWQFLRYFENLSFKRNISKISCHFDLKLMSLLDSSFLSKYNFFLNFWSPSFSGMALYIRP